LKQKGFFSSQPSVRSNQKGMASIVIVSVLVVILTLVSIGFARLMNRAITNSTDKELGVAASYASQSGVNDASVYIKANYDATKSSPLDGVAAGSCNTLLGGTPGVINPNLSGDNNVKYTCLTIDPEPTD
jgi:Tfp pilus assembly protein PilX